MRKIALFTTAIILAGIHIAKSATVDTALTYSQSMNKQIKAVIIKPENYAMQDSFSVVYLLHGFSGNYRDWITKVPAIKQLADNFSIMIVCPDGNFASWYFDSPIDSSVKYETYVAKELVRYIDENYKTRKSKNGRAITGLSMGGHGGLYIAFRNQDVFGAGGSMSGGVDIRPFPQNWDMANRLGDYASHKQNWENNTVINLTHLVTPNALSIIIDCGTGDFFYDVNVALHEKLLYNNIPHDFISRPGGHTWEYWGNAISYQLLYMKHFFDKNTK